MARRKRRAFKEARRVSILEPADVLLAGGEASKSVELIEREVGRRGFDEVLKRQVKKVKTTAMKTVHHQPKKTVVSSPASFSIYQNMICFALTMIVFWTLIDLAPEDSSLKSNKMIAR